MKSAILSALLFAGYISTAHADLVYDIDYEPPAYTNGQQVGGGFGRTISDNISGFSSQGLLLHDGAGGGLSYYASEAFTSGIHHISWDLSIPTQQGSSSIIYAQLESGSILFDTHVKGDGSGLSVEYGFGFPQRPSISINSGQSYAFEILLDLDANYYSFRLDGSLLEDTVSIPSDASLSDVFFGQNQTPGLQAGIDNFRWEVVPEPSSLLLLLCWGTAICLARRNRKIERQ